MGRESIRRVQVREYRGNTAREQDGYVVEEVAACLHINGQPWVTLMCSPHALDDLVLGFLRAEGIIASLDDVLEISPSPNDHCVDVWLRDPQGTLPSLGAITSGCGGGITFASLTEQIPPVREERRFSARAISRLMGMLLRAARLYHQARGIHSAALADGERLLLYAEDIGRHNAVDRVWGQAMKAGIETSGGILLTTGRVSSEMLRKAALMRVPIVASRTSPTGLSVDLARAWNITLVGYVRRNGLRVYTVPERVGE